MSTGYGTGFAMLSGYVLRVARSTITIDNIGPLVADALVAMSVDLHAPDEQATYRRIPKRGIGRRSRITRDPFYQVVHQKRKRGV